MGGLVAHAVMDVQNGVAVQPRRTQQAAGVPLQPQSQTRRSSMAHTAAS
ncbi:GPP34 family phosphoprotein [Streptomyces californicus]